MTARNKPERPSNPDRTIADGGLELLAASNAELYRKMGYPDYLSCIPESVPSGKIVVHNRVRPTRKLGSRGFRAWLAEPSSQYEVCPCEWAPELDAHYRVRGVND